MLVEIIKFLHLIFALGLLGVTIYCVTTKNSSTLQRINFILLILSFFALISGTLLVYPKQFNFHTHWILAAYVFLSIFMGVILLMIFFKKHLRWVYFILMIILIVIMHDAVTKSTFLSMALL